MMERNLLALHIRNRYILEHDEHGRIEGQKILHDMYSYY